MIAISLLTLGALILLATLTILCVTTSRQLGLQPAVVDPFGQVIPSDFGHDTLPNSAAEQVTLAEPWHSVELERLCDVEEVLDVLEANHARGELVIAGNNRFTVRWR